MVTATGSLSLPFAELATLLAASTTFQTEVGTPGNPVAAAAKIDYPYRDLETNGWPVPGAVITDDDTASQRKGRQLDEEGQLYMSLYLPLNPTYAADPQNNLKDFRNKLGAILDEMFALSKTPKPNPADGFYMHVTEWEKSGTPTLCLEPDYDTEFRFAEFRIHWT